MVKNSSNHLDLQAAFAQDIRSDGHVLATTDPRMQIYRDLFFKNIKGFLDSTFPVCAEILGEQYWTELAKKFLLQHASASPYFLKISEEFLLFLNQQTTLINDSPWLLELAHYEWLELAVDVLDTQENEFDNAVSFQSVHQKESGDDSSQDASVVEKAWFDRVPIPTSAAMSAIYNFPVHEISPNNASPNPQTTGIIVFRDQSDRVRFIHTNPFTVALFELLCEQSSMVCSSFSNHQAMSGRESVIHLLKQAQMVLSEAAIDGGCRIIAEWNERGLIVGSMSK
ncbi:MAG: putative DNA-binding domain-containing protein [Oleibacter sp.]|nr:putative DNA-binding domain-containing protein [Thalassolituus sp.]